MKSCPENERASGPENSDCHLKNDYGDLDDGDADDDGYDDIDTKSILIDIRRTVRNTNKKLTD